MIYAVIDTNVIVSAYITKNLMAATSRVWAAMSKEDAYLVTGNKKHFPKKPIVVSPAEMLEILQKEGILPFASTI